MSPRIRRAGVERLTVGLLVVVAGVGAALAPGEPPAGPVTWRPLSSSVLTCPELPVPDGSASVLTGLVAGSTARPAEGTGAAVVSSAALRPIDAADDLARILVADDPVTLLMARRSAPPIVLQATGGWAGATLAGVATRELDGPSAGLASAPCPAPRADWWFVAAGAQLGRSAALLVSNASEEPASFDISLHGQAGPVEALGGKGITLGPRSHVRMRLDALAEGEELLAVRVHATSGRVVAAVRDVAEPQGQRPRGVDYLPAAVPPTRLLWIPGVPAVAQSRALVLVNPGSQFASVSARLLTDTGPVDVPGLATLAVPAGSVISYPLDGVLGEQAGTLELRADGPVTGGVRAVWGTAAARDLLWLAATPPVTEPNDLAGAAAVPAGRGLATSVTITAPAAAVAGTLQVLTSADAQRSPLGVGGLLESGDYDDSEPDGATADPVVLTEPSGRMSRRTVRVQSGAQLTVQVPEGEQAGLLHLVWRSDAGSGPALLSHVTVAADPVLATGYPWWPTASQVPAADVRNDVGTLAPVG